MVKKARPALKHAGYSATNILPGEDARKFEKLHRDLIAELTPDGALEEDIVANLARLLWRKQNLETCRIAEHAQHRWRQIRDERLRPYNRDPVSPYAMIIDPAERNSVIEAAVDEAREELGDTFEFVEIGEDATIRHQMNDFEVEDRLNALIDRCLKRLLFLRGLKSVSIPPPSAPRPRLVGP